MAMLVLALLLLAAVLVSSVIDQLVPKVSSPLIQIGLGLVIALFAPSQIRIGLDPDLFLVLFIAPLLYDEAKSVDKAALWRNRRPVLSLAIGLVVVTALVLGFAVHAVIPSITLASAFALGAALGPTDAVAVASLSKETDIPERQKSILEGESLINDASGIVSFQFALAAAVTGSFSLLDASVDFVVSFFGGILLGVVLGYVGNFLVRRVRSIGLENTTFHVLFEVFTPFIIYLVANAFGASGIIAVVAAGLVNVISPRAIGPSISRMNIVSSSVWRVLSFALNGVVFVLLGTQLPNAMRRTWDDQTIDNFVLVGYILALTFLLLLIRFLWVLAMERVRNRMGDDPHRLSKADLKSALVMALAGPKGTITLAVLFTIPVLVDTSPATYFPQRDLIIFLACGVIVVTLLIATFVVPLLVPKREREKDEVQQDETTCNIEILRNVVEELTARQTPETRRATRTVVHSYNERIARIKESHGLEDEPNVALRLQALRWERDYVEKLHRAGRGLPHRGLSVPKPALPHREAARAQRGPLDGPERLPAAARAFALAVPWHRARAAGRVHARTLRGHARRAGEGRRARDGQAAAGHRRFRRAHRRRERPASGIPAHLHGAAQRESFHHGHRPRERQGGGRAPPGAAAGAGADPDHVRRRAPLPRHGEAPARERLPHAGGSGRQRVGRRAGVRDAGAGSALPHARP